MIRTDDADHRAELLSEEQGAKVHLRRGRSVPAGERPRCREPHASRSIPRPNGSPRKKRRTPTRERTSTDEQPAAPAGHAPEVTCLMIIKQPPRIMNPPRPLRPSRTIGEHPGRQSPRRSRRKDGNPASRAKVCAPLRDRYLCSSRAPERRPEWCQHMGELLVRCQMRQAAAEKPAHRGGPSRPDP